MPGKGLVLTIISEMKTKYWSQNNALPCFVARGIEGKTVSPIKPFEFDTLETHF